MSPKNGGHVNPVRDHRPGVRGRNAAMTEDELCQLENILEEGLVLMPLSSGTIRLWTVQPLSHRASMPGHRVSAPRQFNLTATKPFPGLQGPARTAKSDAAEEISDRAALRCRDTWREIGKAICQNQSGQRDHGCN